MNANLSSEPPIGDSNLLSQLFDVQEVQYWRLRQSVSFGVVRSSHVFISISFMDSLTDQWNNRPVDLFIVFSHCSAAWSVTFRNDFFFLRADSNATYLQKKQWPSTPVLQ